MVEAAIVLTLLCFLFLLVIGLDLREARGFRMAMLARKAAWDPQASLENPELSVDRFEAQSEIMQPLAKEEIFRQGLMRNSRGGMPARPGMVCSRVTGKGLKSNAEFGYEMGFITLPAPDPEFVAITTDPWDSPDNSAQTRQKVQRLVGEQVMFSRYRVIAPAAQASSALER